MTFQEINAMKIMGIIFLPVGIAELSGYCNSIPLALVE
jgi:hypothetical protein